VCTNQGTHVKIEYIGGLKSLMSQVHAVQERFANFGLDISSVPVFSISGTWDKDRCEHLNIHPSHQILTVRDGMLLLEDHTETQPLYRNMAAFIPAEKPHLVRVMRQNQTVTCHSLFIAADIYIQEIDNVCIFEMSNLGTALLRKLNERNLVDLTDGFMGHCLRLFREVLSIDMQKPAHLIRLPEPLTDRNMKIVNFIRDNYMNKIRLEHFTRVIPLSIRQASRIFEQELKISIMQYVRLYRLLQASILLHEPWRTIIDVAYDCGYDSVSSFHEDFKHHFSVPPNRFRKKILQ